ncbi:MAG: hypothetical protein ACYDBJ_25580 [Aggregatilineales bacterium]
MFEQTAQPTSVTPTDLLDDPLASEQIPDLVTMINEINAEHFAKIAALEAQIADLKKLQAEKTRTFASLSDILRVAYRLTDAEARTDPAAQS